MGTRRVFTRDIIEVCRRCKSAGQVQVSGDDNARTICPVCCGSGLVRKHIEGFVAVEPYDKNTTP